MSRIACWLAAGMVALASLTTAQAQQPAAPAEKVSLLLNWYLYSEHAPFFLGRERGYFAEEGIDLDIQEGRGSTPTVQAVAAGTVTFGYADLSSAVKAAAVGAPVVVIGVLLQKSPMAVMGLAERNIRTPQDMRGRTVALTPGDSLSQVWPLLLKRTGLSEGDVKVIGGDMQTKLNAVINGQVDLMLGYLMDQNMRIENATKKPVHVIPFSDYGVNLISSSLIASKGTVTTKGDLVRRFMRAATRAVEEAEKNPEAAVDAMLKANIKAGDRESLIRGLKLTIPLYHTAETKSLRPFRVNQESVVESLTMLAEYGGLDKTAPARARDFVTLDFLPN